MSKKIRKIVFVFFIVFTVFLFALFQVYISYNKIIIANNSITTKQIRNSISLVIISDLHDNQLRKNNKDLIDKINSLSPDILLVVGDMLNKDSKDSQIVTTLMKELCKNHKVFYSLGNTEIDYIKEGTSDLFEELENIGVTVLENEYKDIDVNGNTIRIGGMFGYAFGLKNTKISQKGSSEKDTYDFLSKFENTYNYKIMMAHRPDSFIFNNTTKDWSIDLVVSGHTHGGQVILPFVGGLYVADQGWFPQYDKGLFNLDNTKIIITSGLGSGKQKLPRYNNVPEIVNLELSNKE